MANPVKVSATEEFAALKKEYPASRIGEFIINALDCNPEDLHVVLFHMEDDVLVRRIKASLEGHDQQVVKSAQKMGSF